MCNLIHKPNKRQFVHFRRPKWWMDKPWTNLNSLDSTWSELGRKQHLPPYNILCSSTQKLHSNGKFLKILKTTKLSTQQFWRFINFTLHIELKSFERNLYNYWKEIYDDISNFFALTLNTSFKRLKSLCQFDFKCFKLSFNYCYNLFLWECEANLL